MITPEISRRIEHALDAAAQSRIEGVAALSGNPLQVEVRRFGPITAALVGNPVLYYGYYNTVRGVQEGTLAQLEAAVTWLRGEGAAPGITTSPLLEDEPLKQCLARLQLQPSGSMSVRHDAPFLSPAADTGLTVAESPLAARDDFADLWLAANPSDANPSLLRDLCAAEFAAWRVFVATLDGRASAYGCMSLQGDVAVMASAWTAPEARTNGLQAALLHRRIAEASASGCDLVVSTAAPSSASERNLRRAGLTDGYEQTIWT